jgi:hypothetical protein
MNERTYGERAMSVLHPVPRRELLLSAAAGLAVTALAAGADDLPKSTAGAKAKPEDVGTIDAIVGALYDVISGPKGRARDWDRFRGLFAPGARLIPCVRSRDDPGKLAARMLSVDEFVLAASRSSEQRGFFEREVARETDRFGHIAQIFSTYESREDKDAEPFDRGINSIQLLWDNARWWVVTIYWDRASAEQPIPPEYRAKP